jgi:hypothetical protein
MSVIISNGSGDSKSRRSSDPTAPGQDPASRPATTDHREQLVNGRECGPVTAVALPESMITSLHAVMLDIDPDLFRADRLPEGATGNPVMMYEGFIGPVLGRHSLYRRAEVRDSGRGLHVLLWLDPHVTFEDESDRTRWAAIVRIVQRVLPSDPNAPSITSLTRPVASVNTRTGRRVAALKPGEPVHPDDLLDLVEEVAIAPFKVAAGLLLGSDLSPCPACRGPGTRLGILDKVGRCYSCGEVTLARLFDAYLKPPTAGEDDRG